MTIKSKIIFIIIILKVTLCLFTYADERYLVRHNRAIGGVSLDTSNFVLYVDPNGTRFIEVPKEYIKNWLHDQKMWRTWSIVLGFMCFIFFGILLVFLIHDCCTSTGPLATCIKRIKENPSDDKITSSEMTIPTNYVQTYNIPTTQQTFIVGPH